MDNIDFTALLHKITAADGQFAIITGLAAAIGWAGIKTLSSIAAKSTILASKKFVAVNRWAVNRDRRNASTVYWASYKSMYGVEMARYWMARNTVMSIFWATLLIVTTLRYHDTSTMNTGQMIILMFFAMMTSARTYHVCMDFVMIPNALRLRYNPNSLKGRARRRRKLPPITTDGTS